MSEPVIDLRLWRQFVAVAEALHFGRAAQSLHMTQPPLTQAIAQLERLLEVRLFDRTKRSVKLTAAGAALLPPARDLLARARALPAQARAAQAGELGHLRLGFVSTIGFAQLPQWVRGFRARYPKVGLDLVEATGDVQLQSLERGEIDAGFMLHSPGFAPPALQHLRVTREPLVLAVADPHPLAQHASLKLAQVLDQPLVIFPHRIVPSLHDAILGIYQGAGRTPVIAQEAIQMQTIVNLVSAGLGVAWVPESVRQFQRPGVAYRKVAAARGSPIPGCETSLVWPRHAAPPVLERFIEFIKPATATRGE
ncbi:MAG: LysR family transcriptional regulator [Ramlibacter sp.]|jgi:DNA-binding transcriptional LysR family regulator|nr:LysR family transcriptional regulator [Ramlibacter sp.]